MRSCPTAAVVLAVPTPSPRLAYRCTSSRRPSIPTERALQTFAAAHYAVATMTSHLPADAAASAVERGWEVKRDFAAGTYDIRYFSHSLDF